MTHATQSTTYDGGLVPPSAPVAQGSSRSRLEEYARSFEQDGYVVLKNVVSREKLAALRTTVLDEFERIKRSGSLFSGGGALTGHLNCFPGVEARFALDALHEHGILDLLRAVYSKPFGTPDVGCNLNLPKSVVQHYHVDSSFLEHFIIVNVAVVDTDLVNGAIDVVPGTHKEFHKFWRFALKRPSRLSKRLPLSAGDVLVRTSNLWHRGMPNRSSTARPMLAFTFGEKRGGRADPFEFNDGKIKFYENWFRTNWAGQLRERTYVAAPFTYDAYRFVRSLFGNKGYATQ